MVRMLPSVTGAVAAASPRACGGFIFASSDRLYVAEILMRRSLPGTFGILPKLTRHYSSVGTDERR